MERRKHLGEPKLQTEDDTKTRKINSNQQQPRTCCLCILFFQIIFILFTYRSLFPSSCNGDSYYMAVTNRKCASGMFYVYNLPPEFNLKLIENCANLVPGKSLCDGVLNGGIGPEATGLEGVVPEDLAPAWYFTDQFTSEVIFHNRAMNHRCRTLDPEWASAFYIPFYARFALEKYLWVDSSATDRDSYGRMLMDWLKNQRYWKRSNGADHFITIGRITWDYRRGREDGWGSSFFTMPEMKNVTRLLIERNPWDAFEVGVPYPTGFHPTSESDVAKWQDYVRNRERTTLFCFVGGTRENIKNDFRSMLMSHCKNETDSCQVVDCTGNRCNNGTSTILNTFLNSDFCLQPRGDSLTRRSVFDCMVAGSIPVFFWNRTAYDQYEWHLPPDPASYSVFINNFKVMRKGTSIKKVLVSMSKEDIRRMREQVIEYIPKIVYAKPIEGLETVKDAFDVALDGVLRRFKGQNSRRLR
ncbi:Exostosin, GT47 domain [Dillenia turbinata]|uniref:Exostosin, GT47 domain n=1 Tax=Dillenia turbinata TaxID=194707 RepID=A0AAN8ZAF0_9MAGN